MAMKKLLIGLLAASLLVACEKEEQPVAPALGGTFTAGMGGDYNTSLFYHLGSAQFVQTESRDTYHLACLAGTAPYFYLNGANFMRAKQTGVSDFAAVTDTAGFGPWGFDYPTGATSRTAIGTWWDAQGNSKGEVYLLDFGYDLQYAPLGVKKMQVVGNTSSFSLRLSNLNGTKDTLIAVQQSATAVRTRIALLPGYIASAEPDAQAWDLQFAQYTDFDLTDAGDTLYYLVRGVLTNPTRTRALKVTDTPWENITATWAEGKLLSADWNTIGYDWKAFPLSSNVYQIVPDQYYVLQDGEGTRYKLRFLDYYNDQGEKGYAKFELITL